MYFPPTIFSTENGLFGHNSIESCEKSVRCHCTEDVLQLHLPSERYLADFQFLVTTNIAAMNIQVEIFV